jgi:hypothetical protein
MLGPQYLYPAWSCVYEFSSKGKSRPVSGSFFEMDTLKNDPVLNGGSRGVNLGNELDLDRPAPRQAKA